MPTSPTTEKFCSKCKCLIPTCQEMCVACERKQEELEKIKNNQRIIL